jgi:RNA polymerase sigma-70 factor (ECF subfamily)
VEKRHLVHNSPSLDELVLAHLPDALRFATRLTGDLHAAEDIVSEALLRAVRSWPSFRGEAAFRTWLWRIVLNVFRDRLRARHTNDAGLDEAEEVADTSVCEPIDAVLAVELGQLVAREVSGLPPRQREVLVLAVYESLSTAEIAAAAEITEANVHATLSLARARLKQRLARYLTPEGTQIDVDATPR